MLDLYWSRDAVWETPCLIQEVLEQLPIDIKNFLEERLIDQNSEEPLYD